MGGAGLPFAVIVVVVFVVIVLVVLNGLVPMAKRQQERAAKMRDPEVESLSYVVPPGQDQAAIVAALTKEGFGAVTEQRDGMSLVLIETREGKDRQRAHARAVIAHSATLNMEGAPMPEHEVKFTDEPGGT